DNAWFTVALELAPLSGTLGSTLPKDTSGFEGERVPNSGSVAATLPSVSSDFDGTHHVPATGTMTASLPAVTSSIVGEGEAGGVVAASIVITTQLQAETRQFDEHVILVEKEHRAFLVVDDGFTDIGLKEIKRSKVTQT